jgi:hypothetical protein
MCSLPSIQARDLEEFQQSRTKQTRKPEAEAIEILVSDNKILLNRI